MKWHIGARLYSRHTGLTGSVWSVTSMCLLVAWDHLYSHNAQPLRQINFDTMLYEELKPLSPCWCGSPTSDDDYLCPGHRKVLDDA